MRLTFRSLLLALAGCVVLGNGPASKPRVQASWQQRLATELETSGPEATDGWGLFSQGGWADNGQVLVLAAKGGGAKVLLVDPAKKTISSERMLSQSELDAFKAKLAPAAGLADLTSTAMDALNYEYVHLVKGADGHVSVGQRVYYGTGSKPVRDYDALVAAFLDLRRPPPKP